MTGHGRIEKRQIGSELRNQECTYLDPGLELLGDLVLTELLLGDVVPLVGENLFR